MSKSYSINSWLIIEFTTEDGVKIQEQFLIEDAENINIRDEIKYALKEIIYSYDDVKSFDYYNILKKEIIVDCVSEGEIPDDISSSVLQRV